LKLLSAAAAAVTMEPIVGILELNSKIRHGFTKRGVPLYMFYPYNESIQPMLVSYKGSERVNHVALAKVESEAISSGLIPRGGLIEVLGPAGQESVELDAIQWQYAPCRWKNDMTGMLQTPVLGADRVYLVSKPTINIDPKGCRDIDDVVSLWKEGERWKIAVSISDVASWVGANPHLTRAARMGQTLYQDGAAVVSMFSKELSEGLFSLLPEQERRAVSLIASWDGKELSELTWKKSVVKTWASYTYENCYGAREIDMGVLKAIAGEILGSETDDSHKWIEALMIWYNTEAAKLLLKQGCGVLRTHAEPEMEKILLWEGLGLPARELAYPAAVYTAIEEGREEYPHWGLSRSAYCHASSPIRRYADVLNQSVLLSAISGYGAHLTRSWVDSAAELQALEKRAKRYERDLTFIRAFFHNKDHKVNGVLIESSEKRAKVYVGAWKKIITCEPIAGIRPGTEVVVSYYAFLGRRSWKKKMVFKIESQ
jgi:exoribonuclease R